MNAVFADTFYFLALLNPRDAAHQKAVSFSAAARPKIVTTDWILTEVADALSRPPFRELFSKLLRLLATEPDCQVISANADLFEQGVALYVAREDKSWSLTDCISFCMMRAEGIQEALTADHHFEQAGFTALLR